MAGTERIEDPRVNNKGRSRKRRAAQALANPNCLSLRQSPRARLAARQIARSEDPRVVSNAPPMRAVLQRAASMKLRGVPHQPREGKSTLTSHSGDSSSSPTRAALRQELAGSGHTLRRGTSALCRKRSHRMPRPTPGACLDKPDAELIAGRPPAIAMTSPRVHHSPRTIGTVTEVHHVLGFAARPCWSGCMRASVASSSHRPLLGSLAYHRSAARRHALTRSAFRTRNPRRNRPGGTSTCQFHCATGVHTPSDQLDQAAMHRIPCPALPEHAPVEVTSSTAWFAGRSS